MTSLIPPAPDDSELKNVIDKLAQFVARNGPDFEAMTKQKQKDNPRFAFLYGGDYYLYYQYKVSTEQAIIKKNMGSHAQPSESSRISILKRQMLESERNLQAQREVLDQQRLKQIDDAICNNKLELATKEAGEFEIDLTNLDNVLEALSQSCTKETVAKGKSWILTQCNVNPECINVIMVYLCVKINQSNNMNLKLHILYLLNDILHHCFRRSESSLIQMLKQFVPELFCIAQLSATSDIEREKLEKLLSLWEKNDYFEAVVVQSLRNASATLSTLRQSERNSHPQIVSEVSQRTSQQLIHFQQQHSEFVRHVEQQIAMLDSTQVSSPLAISTPVLSVRPIASFPPNFSMPPSFSMPPPAFSNVAISSQDQLSSDDNSYGLQPSTPTNDQQQDASAKRKSRFDAPPKAVILPPPGLAAAASSTFANAPLPNPFNSPPQFGQPPPTTGPWNSAGVRTGTSLPFGIQQNAPYPPSSEMPPGFLPLGIRSLGPQPPRMLPTMQIPYGMGTRPTLRGPESLVPSVMYYDLPAGLMTPLVKLHDFKYKPLKPDQLRLPPPLPPSERLLAAVEAFYSPPSHDNPRDSDGWERNGLYEFFRAKKEAKKEVVEMDRNDNLNSKVKHDSLDKSKRKRSPSSSPSSQLSQSPQRRCSPSP